MGAVASIDKDKVFETIKTNPEMAYSEFIEKSKLAISDVSFYKLRIEYRKANNHKPYKLTRTAKSPKASKVTKNGKKRKYTRSGKYSKKNKVTKQGRRSYNRTVTCLVLWTADSRKIKPETTEVLQDVVRALQKSKQMRLELVQILDPPRLELREHSGRM